jgi:hypothetical protein
MLMCVTGGNFDGATSVDFAGGLGVTVRGQTPFRSWPNTADTSATTTSSPLAASIVTSGPFDRDPLISRFIPDILVRVS